jgi:hypothetical protein
VLLLKRGMRSKLTISHLNTCQLPKFIILNEYEKPYFKTELDTIANRYGTWDTESGSKKSFSNVLDGGDDWYGTVKDIKKSGSFGMAPYKAFITYFETIILNLRDKITKHINHGRSVFAYITKYPLDIPNVIHTVRTGIFSIAKELDIPITLVAIDFIDTKFHNIQKQNFHLEIGDTFKVDNIQQAVYNSRKYYKKTGYKSIWILW